MYSSYQTLTLVLEHSFAHPKEKFNVGLNSFSLDLSPISMVQADLDSVS